MQQCFSVEANWTEVLLSWTYFITGGLLLAFDSTYFGYFLRNFWPIQSIQKSTHFTRSQLTPLMDKNCGPMYIFLPNWWLLRVAELHRLVTLNYWELTDLISKIYISHSNATILIEFSKPFISQTVKWLPNCSNQKERKKKTSAIFRNSREIG